MPPKSRRPVLPSPLRGLSASGRQLVAGVTAWRLTCLKTGFCSSTIHDTWFPNMFYLIYETKQKSKNLQFLPKEKYIAKKNLHFWMGLQNFWVYRSMVFTDDRLFLLYGLLSGRLPENVWNHVNLKRAQCTNNLARKQNKPQQNSVMLKYACRFTPSNGK